MHDDLTDLEATLTRLTPTPMSADAQSRPLRACKEEDRDDEPSDSSLRLLLRRLGHLASLEIPRSRLTSFEVLAIRVNCFPRPYVRGRTRGRAYPFDRAKRHRCL